MRFAAVFTAATILLQLPRAWTASDDPCTVYIAKASSDDAIVPVSFYAGVDFAANMTIGNPELGIHWVDLAENTKGVSPPFDNVIQDHCWTPSEITSQFEDNSGDNGYVFLSGLGFAGSINPGIFNARWNRTAVFNRYRTLDVTSALDWRKDAMTCAVSDFFNVQLTSTTAIRAGSEIFPFFGDAWLQSKEESAANDPNIRLKRHFDKAEEVLSQYAALIAKHKDFFTEDRAQDYWDFIVNDVIQDEKVRSLLPASYHKISETLGKSLISYQYANVERSLEYLSSHGTCMDNLVQGAKSTIPGAGRGAFAKRAISKGDIVAAAPLVRLYKHHLHTFPIDEVTKERLDEVPELQLLMNYVLGHPKSPFVFYPYGTGVNLINHATHGQFVPNVKFVWSEKEYHNAKYLEMDLETIENEGLSPLVHVMDIVATSDILAGEEILLDYGQSFDQSLKQFILAYQESISEFSIGNESAAVLNAKNEPFRTVKDQVSSPYPDDIDIICYYDNEAARPFDSSSLEFLKDVEPKIDPSITPLLSYVDGLNGIDRHCDILHIMDVDGEGNEPRYLVRVRSDGDDVYVADVPHSAILFVDIPYSSPSQGTGSFRHYIEIPDEVFPKAWKVDS
jgi:hypothetical protein